SSSSFPAAKAKFHSSADRLEVFIDYSNKIDQTQLRVAVAKATSSKLENLVETVVKNYETFCETFPAITDETISEDITLASKRSSDLLSRSDTLSVVLNTAIIGESSLSHKDETTKKAKLPKVEMRHFDECYPEIWFDEVEIQMKAAQISDEFHQFATLTRFLDSKQSLFVSGILRSKNPAPYTSAKEVLLQQYSLSKIQKIRKAIFEEKRGGEEKASNLLSRIEPLLKDVGNSDIKKFVIYHSLPESVKEHVALKFEESSVQDFTKACDALLDVHTNKDSSTVAA
ncbi:Hypothetical predicted protein, partial [Paramuricea clavata]